MARVLPKLVVVALLVVVVAGVVVALRSGDPVYTAQEWLGGGLFKKYDDLIAQAAGRHRVDPLLVKAVIWRESRFHAGKHGKHGERGLMQVTEGAAEDWVKAEKIETFDPTDLLEPKTNVEVGTWYLAQAMQHWSERDDPVPFALAEYNAGRSRVERWISGEDPAEPSTAAEFRQQIDFPGTRRYVESILVRYNFYRERNGL